MRRAPTQLPMAMPVSPLRLGFGGFKMATIASLLPRASATSVASIESFITIALFSGIGLLLSLSILILDQQIPGEWF